jgi:hypothetical protein
MEEALRCARTTAVIGRDPRRRQSTVLRYGGLSLAAAESARWRCCCGHNLQADASTAATRWVVGAAPSTVPGIPRLVAQLVRIVRGPTGTWILEWSDSDGQFILGNACSASWLRRFSTDRIVRSHKHETFAAAGRSPANAAIIEVLYRRR